MQEGHPITFMCKVLIGKNLAKSFYEKDMLTTMQAITHWRSYLLGWHFQIKTNHYCLTYLFKQWVSSLDQQKWITKFIGYDNEITYRKGKDSLLST